MCYVTDHELDFEQSEFYNPFYVKNLTAFLHGADLLITDTTYSDDEYRTGTGGAIRASVAWSTWRMPPR
jgi:hypothetical protein